MSLDLGELRASVVIDRKGVAPGLAAVDREIKGFTRKLDADTRQAGDQAGQNLTGRMVAKLRSGVGQLGRAGADVGRTFGKAAADEMGAQFPRGLRSVGDRIKTWAHGQVTMMHGEGRNIGGALGNGIGFGVKSGLGVMGGALRGGAKLLAGFAAGGVAALGLVGGAAAVMGGKVASANEQAVISFTTMLRKAGDTEKEARGRATSFIGDLQKLAATTPFEFADLQASSAKLVSAGIDVQKIIPMMKNLGDVTAGVGTGKEGIERATVALQQMIAAQKISAEDLNQLRDAGIPVYDLLAGATGKSKKEIVDLAHSGELGKKELDALLRTLSSDTPKGLERFSGLMSKQSKSLAGMWSNLTDTVSQGLGRVGTKAMPELKRGLGGVSALLTSVFKYLDSHGDDISRIFKAGGRAVHSFWGIVKPVLKAFSGSLTDGQDVLTSLADWLDTHQGDMVGFFTGLAHGAIAFGKVTAEVVSIALKAYGGLQKGVQAVLEFILARTQEALALAAAGAEAVGAHGQARKLTSAAGTIQGMRDNNRKNSSGADAAAAIAAGIDNKLLPALNRADDALKRNGKRIEDNARKGDAWRGALNAISRSVDANGTSLSEHSKKGRENRKVVEGSIKALNKDAQAAYDNKAAKGDLKGAERAAAKVIRDGTQDIRDQARKAGLNKDAVQKMIDKLRHVPKTVHTDITFSTNARAVLGKLQGSVKGNQALANSDKNVTARGGLTGRFMGQLPGNTPLHRGDDLALPLLGGGIQHLRGGEGVQVTEAMDPYEQRRLDAMNHGVLGGLSPARVRGMLGEPAGLARGGTVGSSAVPAAVEDLGPEARAFAVRNARQTAEIYMASTRRILQKAMDYNGGGNTGKALAYARAHEGHPYVFGTLWDCSGLVSALHSIAKGEPPHRRYSTTAFHGSSAQGFTRGKHSNFEVGVNPAPGKSGHMVAKINGHRVEEAGGVGLRVDGGARDVSDPMFSWRGGLAYGGRVVGGRRGDMPMDLINPRGGRRYSPILADLAEALVSGRGYGSGTLSAAAGFHWTGEKGAELVVNPQMRRYSGGEQVLAVGKSKDSGGGLQPVVGTLNIHAADVRGGLQQLHFAVRSRQVGRR